MEDPVPVTVKPELLFTVLIVTEDPEAKMNLFPLEVKFEGFEPVPFELVHQFDVAFNASEPS
jgi:hypothetical protein